MVLLQERGLFGLNPHQLILIPAFRCRNRKAAGYGLGGPLCSRKPHDEKDWKDIHVGPMFPERAP